MDDSAIICDEIRNVKETNFNKKHITCKTQGFYILLAFLLTTIALLITVSICCYLIKYCAKQITTQMISRHFTTQIYIDNID